MPNEYLYGAYGHMGETVAQTPVQSGTVAVYIGTAPVHLIAGYKATRRVNEPLKLGNLADAQKQLGTSKNWASFTLCEAVAAHFENPLGNIGPIYVINVLDPERHKKAEPTTQSLTFSAGRAEFASDTAILDTVMLADKVRDVDFTVGYNGNKGVVLVSSANAAEPLTGTIEATYEEVDPSGVLETDIIGGVSATGEYTGLGVLQLLYPRLYAVPNLIAAPGWSEKPAVYNALITASQRINGHWDAFVLADLPVPEAATIDAAVLWKREKAYTSERSKVFWPRIADNLGRVFHLSTQGMVAFLKTDFSHNSVPMETCGNKPIPAIRQHFGEHGNQGFDQQAANALTSNGISTAVAWGGRWVLWGSHTAAYAYGADVDPRALFDVSMRMLMHVTNDFQREWSPEIDSPMDRALKDRIMNREQEKLDAYVSMGALIGEPKIFFLETENALPDRMNGDFRWDLTVTPTPPLKSASVYVAYTDAGFAAYFEGGDE